MNKDKNPLVLAYIGDSVFDLYIRNYLVSQNIVKVKMLQSESVKYVSAKAQARFMEILINNNFLTDKELDIFYRARNHKGSRHPKNTDIITYKISTGFEAVIGYLYLEKSIQRINEIINYLLEV